MLLGAVAHRWSFDEAITTLGKEFVRRGMPGHAGRLRRFWAHWKKGSELRRDDWTWERVVEWLCMLRVAPFDRVYGLHPKFSSVCPGCEVVNERQRPTTKEVQRWQGGALLECGRCGARWLTDSAWEAETSGLAQARR